MALFRKWPRRGLLIRPGLLLGIVILAACLLNPGGSGFLGASTVRAQDLAGLAPSGEPWPVGRVITPKGPVCTGVLIGPAAVLTAAHCLTTRAGDGYFSASLVHFGLVIEDGEQLYAKATQLHVAPDYPLPVSTDPASLSHDWAVMVIDTPLGEQVPPAPILAAADWTGSSRTTDPQDWTLSVIAFGRARAMRPTIAGHGCRVLERRPPLFVHDCVVEPGSSGSVLLAVRGTELRALAVNVAVRRGTTSSTTATLPPAKAIGLAGARPPRGSLSGQKWESPFDSKGTARWD